MKATPGCIEQIIRDAVGVAQNMRRPEAVVAALNAIRAADLDVFFHPGLESQSVGVEPATTGLPASPGAAVGEVVLHAARAVEMADAGHSVILVRSETTADDVLGM